MPENCVRTALTHLVCGERFEQNRSRFLACGAPLRSTDGIGGLIDDLAREFRLGKATHLSWAARCSSGDGSVLESRGDGGESGSGRCILEIMQACNTLDSLVLVARWYGGRHLGGARFRIYRKLTMDLLSREGSKT